MITIKLFNWLIINLKNMSDCHLSNIFNYMINQIFHQLSYLTNIMINYLTKTLTKVFPTELAIRFSHWSASFRSLFRALLNTYDIFAKIASG